MLCNDMVGCISLLSWGGSAHSYYKYITPNNNEMTVSGHKVVQHSQLSVLEATSER